MKAPINFISRKRLPQYNSIEELFINIKNQLEEECDVIWTELPNSGASPKSILGNLKAVKPSSNAIYHITGDVNYMAISLADRCVLTIHDIHSALTGNWIKRKIKEFFWFKLAAKKAKFITVISEFTKNELVEIIPKEAHKIRVVYNPINSKIKPNKDYVFNTLKPNILLIGTKANKNLERSIEALKNLSLKILIIGKLSEDQRLLLKHSKLEFQNFESLTFDQVLNCYELADILCFPSLYEGFGMPIIEAQAAGKPVLTSQIGAMKEVAGNAACFVDPLCANSIRQGILKIIDEENYRNSLISMGFENVKRFSLEKTISKFKDLYREIGN